MHLGSRKRPERREEPVEPGGKGESLRCDCEGAGAADERDDDDHHDEDHDEDEYDVDYDDIISMT